MRLFPLAIALLLIASVGLAAGGALTGAAVDHTAGIDDISSGVSAAAADSANTVSTVQSELSELFSMRALSTDPDAVERVELDRHHADLGPAINLGTTRDSESVTKQAIDRRLGSIESDSERQRQILGELNTIEQQLVTLEEERSAVIAAYNDDEIDAHEFLVEIARLQQVATDLEGRLDVLAMAADDTDGYSISSDRQREISSNLELFTGPVASYATEVLRGEHGSEYFYVETTDSGIVLSAIDGDQHVREVLRPDRRDTGAGTIDDPEIAETVVAESYPELWNRSTSTRVQGEGSIVRVTVVYDGGELVAFVDGGSEQIFREYRSTALEATEFSTAVNRTQSGLDVTVERTHVGSPFVVTVTEIGDDTPIAGATVTVAQGEAESEVIGVTDADGVVWGIEPRGTYTISVIDGTNSAFVELESDEPAPLAGEE